MAQFHASVDAIVSLLENRDDRMLEEKVDYREYNFRSLLNGWYSIPSTISGRSLM